METIDPDAREMAEIRNQLEHKYLKIHNNLWKRSTSEKDFSFVLKDSLSFSMYRNEFEFKTLKLIKLARAALIYLSLAIHKEEIKRSKGRRIERVVPIQLDKYDDKWKI